MASCDDIRPILGAYADGQLGPVETDAVVAHLEQCGRCRQLVRDQQQVQHVLDSWQPPVVSNAEWVEMGRRLRAELEGKGEPIVLKTLPRSEALDPTPPASPALRPEEVRIPLGPESEPANLGRASPKKAGLRLGGAGLRPGEAGTRRWWSKSAAESAAPVPAAGRPGPTVSVLRVTTRRPRARFGWVAHLVGMAAAGLILFFGVISPMREEQPAKVEPPPPLPVVVPAPVPVGPIVLAQWREVNSDVQILDVEMMDDDYSVVVQAADTPDAACVWVVPSGSSG
jgi:hypothetical protein